MDETRSRLLRCFGAVFPSSSKAELEAASLGDVDGWDSVATITLLSLVEEEFGVEFEPQDLEWQTSFARILEHLKGKGIA